MRVEIVSATRLPEGGFGESPLGRTLKRVAADKRLVPHIAFENSMPLGAVYNARIQATAPADILLFVHDDVFIEDFYFCDRIIEGLKVFDVIGIAGSRVRTPRQVSWGRPDDGRSRHMLAGAIAHGNEPMGKAGFFGPIIAQCELMDGVFLAAKKADLVKNRVRFDPQFAFHFYDLDFCRSARAKGLKLGTWPISMTHQSTGGFGTDAWQKTADAYFAKWGD